MWGCQLALTAQPSHDSAGITAVGHCLTYVSAICLARTGKNPRILFPAGKDELIEGLHTVLYRRKGAVRPPVACDTWLAISRLSGWIAAGTAHGAVPAQGAGEAACGL